MAKLPGDKTKLLTSTHVLRFRYQSSLGYNDRYFNSEIEALSSLDHFENASKFYSVHVYCIAGDMIAGWECIGRNKCQQRLEQVQPIDLRPARFRLIDDAEYVQAKSAGYITFGV